MLVLHDLLGIHDGLLPKFAQRFADVKAEMLRGVAAYAEAVRTRTFPGEEHTYGIAAGGDRPAPSWRCAAAPAHWPAA